MHQPWECFGDGGGPRPEVRCQPPEVIEDVVVRLVEADPSLVRTKGML